MIYLYGDSFVENERAVDLGQHDHERWYQMLSKNLDEENDNHGKCGEGPSETLAKFHRHYEQGYFQSNPKFVFFLSSTYRIPWTWLDPTTDPNKSPSDKRDRTQGMTPSSGYQDWDVEQERKNGNQPAGKEEYSEYYFDYH